MIPSDALILLDTSVMVHLARDDALGQRVNSEHALSTRSVRPLISIISVGELFALASKWEWGEAKIARLRDLVGTLTVVGIRPPPVIDRYAAIDAYSEQTGRRMENNDAWIAPTAAAAAAWLLTTDKDFDHLHPKFIQRELIDPGT